MWRSAAALMRFIKTRKSDSVFQLLIDEISGKKLLLKFTGASVEKTYEIDVQKLRKDQRPKGFFDRSLNRQEKHWRDYEEWLNSDSLNAAPGMEAEAYFL